MCGEPEHIPDDSDPIRLYRAFAETVLNLESLAEDAERKAARAREILDRLSIIWQERSDQ
jgi:hypothetical protein